MKICYIADGRSMHFHRWISYFAGRGDEIHFVSYHPVEERHVEAIREAGGIFQGELPPFHLKRFWITRRSLRWLKNTLRDNKIEAVHCHFLGANAWYAFLTGFHPYILTVMGGGDVSGPDWRPQGLRAGILTPLALRHAELITSWSYQMAKVIKRYCDAKTPVEVIHGGVDLTRFHPGGKPGYLLERWEIPATARVVFSPRLMRPLSNIETIARSSLEVVKVEPETYFLYAAPGALRDSDYERQLREMLKNSVAESNTRFVGAITHEEIADYYRLADVTVSIPDTDGTPMSVLESMACGTPVVVGDIPDYDPDYFEPGVTVITANQKEPSSVAAAVLKLLRETDQVEPLVEEARRRVVANGSYEAQMSRMEQLYQSLMSNG
ncbi:MAG: glycosyltransferase family 4 protein [Blastocatellia bacterium]